MERLNTSSWTRVKRTERETTNCDRRGSPEPCVHSTTSENYSSHGAVSPSTWLGSTARKCENNCRDLTLWFHSLWSPTISVASTWTVGFSPSSQTEGMSWRKSLCVGPWSQARQRLALCSPLQVHKALVTELWNYLKAGDSVYTVCVIVWRNKCIEVNKVSGR
jgi:hypothetical protein